MTSSISGSAPPPISYRTEEDDTTITFITDENNRVKVKLMDGLMAESVGGGRRVSVLEVTVLEEPVRVDPSAVAYMFSARPSAYDKSVQDAMLMSLPTISQGDVIVIIIGAIHENNTPLTFIVRDVSQQGP